MRIIEAQTEDYLPYPHLFIEVEPKLWIEVDTRGYRPTIKEARRFVAKLLHDEAQNDDMTLDRVPKKWILKYLPGAHEVEFKPEEAK